jgi:lipoprotein-anchoring transpeptidase ErfK/SrfK
MVAGGVLALVVAGATVLALGRGGTEASVPLSAAVPANDPLAPPLASGLAVPHPQLLAVRDFSTTSSWAPVVRPLQLRAAPSATAAVVARVDVSTPEHTANVVLVTGRTRAAAGLWVPVRAENVAGWAPRASLGGYESVDTRLEVDTHALTATLLRAGRVVFRAPVGIGTANAPTPTGSFYVRNRLTRYRSPFYGPVAFGTSARSSLTDWPAGGFVGIHGTNRPDLIPGRVSHGCIRLRNADIVALARLMPVGTPIAIR